MEFPPFPTDEGSPDAPRDRAIQQIVQIIFPLVRLGSHRASQALAQYELTIAQYHTLAYLSFRGRRCPMGELAEAVLQNAATMTGIAGRLEDKGLVCRKYGRADRRKVYVVLQEPGQQIVEQVTRAWYQSGMVLLDDLNQEMLEGTVQVLQMMLDRLQPGKTD